MHNNGIYHNSQPPSPDEVLQPEDYSSFLHILIDNFIDEQTTANNRFDEININGSINSILAFASVAGLITEEQINSYIQRLEGIRELKDNDLIPQVPVMHITPNAAGDKFLLNLQKVLNAKK